jgi:hypothetical protein
MLTLTRILDRRAEKRANELNRAVRTLPLSTRQAMLAAAEAEELIAGAYTDGRGGACPMLAAHRRGARAHVRGFPRAWDAFTGAARPRPVTRRELEILKAMLQESIAGDAAATGPWASPDSSPGVDAPTATSAPTEP